MSRIGATKAHCPPQQVRLRQDDERVRQRVCRGIAPGNRAELDMTRDPSPFDRLNEMHDEEQHEQRHEPPIRFRAIFARTARP